MIRIFNKLEIDGHFLNIIQCIYEKLTVNIIFNGERLKTLCKIRNKTCNLLSPILFNTVWEVLARAIKQEK